MSRLKIFSSILIVILTCLLLNACSNTQKLIEHNYYAFSYKVEPSVLEKRIFFLMNEMKQSSFIFSKNEALLRLNKQQINEITAKFNSHTNINGLADALEINSMVEKESAVALGNLYHQSASVQTFVKNKIRKSNFYELSNHLADSLLFLNAWKEQIAGINYIIDAYLRNLGLHYPQIDASSFNTKSVAYFNAVKAIVQNAAIAQDPKNNVLFETNLEAAIAILQLNKRNEAGRFEPLSNVNATAYKRVKKINWQHYLYTSILVFGAGPDKKDEPFNPLNKIRCDSAVALFKKDLAPFLLVSGGFVHPAQTRYCEAMEMKRYIMQQYHISSEAIIVEPYARHTTTNIRNANRILIDNHFPLNKPVLCVSSEGHIDYIVGPQFLKTFQRDIGFVPFTNMQRISTCEAAYFPAISSLQINSEDPLDP